MQVNNEDVFLGPVDDYVLAPVARFSGAWDVPLLTPGGQPSAFDIRKDYPLLTRLKGYYTEYIFHPLLLFFYIEVGRLLWSVVNHWGWEVLGLLYEENDEKEDGHSVCHFTLASIYETFNNTKPHLEKFNCKSITNFTQLILNFQDKDTSES
ncbi:hypothetical protein Pcinc_019727 [Petrolisthes cinctipes]|uniref:Receptor ligand binding region domain-containing protein n=1 Tax=Petrolisthes cinctipes TaxID=88211 RepID=A0AAE1FKE6_PETCI|nr:hypothetical protein Pcinc_019727 [Petrolisthes cinctipes]